MSSRLNNDYAIEVTRALGAVACAPPGADSPSRGSTATNDEHSQGSGGLLPFRRADLARDDLTGITIGPYALGKRLGKGGMGTVYHAIHTRLERQVAIKFVAVAALSHPDAAARFRQESLALGRLKHDHIVDAFDAGTADGVPYLVTEYILGEDLNHCVARRGPLPVGEACAIIHQAALGLDYAHRHGFLHRDVKPANLLIDQSRRVKLIDFGLVRSSSQDDGLTTTGQMLGTWDYIAPEQANDSTSATPASDIYSLGCTLVFLLTGSPPFASDAYRTSMAKLKGHLVDRSPALDDLRGRTPRPLAELLEHMLAKSPAGRPADLREVAAVLAPFASPTAIAEGSHRPRTAWLVGGSLAAATVVGAACWLGLESKDQSATPVVVDSKPHSDESSPTVTANTEPIGEAASAKVAPSPQAPPDYVTATTKQTANAAGVPLSLQTSLSVRRSEPAAAKSSRLP